MVPHVPLVSLGMPAYSSARTIRESIDCVLGQDFQDLELIVSDNASTDDTWAILQEYAARDPRVVILRQPQNIGANGNYTAVFQAARGRYFKWASSNDWCAPQFLSRCVDYLEAHPDTVLVSPRTRLFHDIIDNGTDYDGDRSFEHADALRRFADVTSQLKLNNVLNGVVRVDALRRTRLIEHYRGADVVLVGHLALLGKIALLDEHLFGRRMDRETATPMMDAEAVHRHHYPHKTWRSLFPAWRHAAGCARAALATDLSRAQKLRALGWVARLSHWRSAELRRDVVDALRYPFR
jgi:glycosyltransferase involved in cell wall biosynthesis